MVAGTAGSQTRQGHNEDDTGSIISAGIDTAKRKLDVAIHGQKGTVTVENAAAGWTQLAARLTQAGVTRVGIEATGNYQPPVTRFLQKAGFTVIVLQRLQVRAFGMLRLQLAKRFDLVCSIPGCGMRTTLAVCRIGIAGRG